MSESLFFYRLVYRVAREHADVYDRRLELADTIRNWGTLVRFTSADDATRSKRKPYWVLACYAKASNASEAREIAGVLRDALEAREFEVLSTRVTSKVAKNQLKDVSVLNLEAL